MELGDIDVKNAAEPEVVQAVVDEIQRLGKNMKENYEKIRKNYEELKTAVDEGSEDPLAQEKITKLSEDISTRQAVQDELNAKAAAAQKEFIDRMDKFEVAIQRPFKGDGSEDTTEEFKQAKQFMIVAASAKAGDEGVRYERVEQMEVKLDEYREYRKSFISYLRKHEKLISPEEIS